MRISEAALALIERQRPDGGAEYLVQWSESWRRFSLVGGHLEPGESFRACCEREVAEELDLTPGVDFRVAASPLRPLQEYVAMSHGAGVETRYRVELYAVSLLTQDAMLKITADPGNRWLNPDEISRMMTADSSPVSEQVRTVLGLFGVL